MRRVLLAFAFTLSASTLGLAAPAHAQSGEPSDHYSYRFEDDYMVGETLSSTPALLRIRDRLPRVNMIRPRASFVAEMFKSVETM